MQENKEKSEDIFLISSLSQTLILKLYNYTAQVYFFQVSDVKCMV